MLLSEVFLVDEINLRTKAQAVVHPAVCKQWPLGSMLPWDCMLVQSLTSESGLPSAHRTATPTFTSSRTAVGSTSMERASGRHGEHLGAPYHGFEQQLRACCGTAKL